MSKKWDLGQKVLQSLEYIISILFMVVQYELHQDASVTHYIGLVLLVLASATKLIYFKYPNRLIDLSPFFIWLLILQRILFMKDVIDKSNVLIFYIIGFNNGQCSSCLRLEKMNIPILLGKLGIQQVIFITLLFYYYKEAILINVLLVLLMLTIICLEMRTFRSETQDMNIRNGKYQNSNHSSICQGIIQEIPCGSLIKNKQQCSQSQQEEQSAIQIEKSVQLRNLNPQPIWQTFIEQCEEYICKIVLTSTLDQSFEEAISNYSFSKFLQDNKISLKQFLKDIQVSNDLNINTYDCYSQENTKVINFYEWINNTLEQNKGSDPFLQKKPYQPLSPEEYLSVSSPDGQRAIMIMDAYLEKSISGMSAIPLQQGSLDVSNLKNRIILYGKIKTIKNTYDLCIQFCRFEEIVDEKHQQVIALLIRDIERQVKSAKQNLKNIDKINSASKFIERQAGSVQEIHKFTQIFLKNQTTEQDRSRQVTQLVKQTVSLASHRDSIDEFYDYSDQNIKNVQNQQAFFKRLSCLCFQMQQNMFNYFEVNSIKEIVDLQRGKINLSQSLNMLFEILSYDEIVIKYHIKFVLEDQNLSDKVIITDTRRMKQLITNILNNSIKAYDQEYRLKSLNQIEIKLTNYEDNIIIEIINQGCGVTQDQLKSKRLLECKLGLAASQKLLQQIGSGTKQLIFKCSSKQNKTNVQFEIPQNLMVDKIEVESDGFDYETIQYQCF